MVSVIISILENYETWILWRASLFFTGNLVKDHIRYRLWVRMLTVFSRGREGWWCTVSWVFTGAEQGSCNISLLTSCHAFNQSASCLHSFHLSWWMRQRAIFGHRQMSRNGLISKAFVLILFKSLMKTVNSCEDGIMVPAMRLWCMFVSLLNICPMNVNFFYPTFCPKSYFYGYS